MSARGGAPRFDSLLLRAWVRELGGAAGARVQKIFEPEDGSFVLHLYPSPDGAPLYLRLKGAGFVGWADPGLANPQEPPALCMLLRKHLENAVLDRAEQPVLDRCLHLVFRKKDGDGDPSERRLVYELLGTRANLHLLGPEGRILGSARRYPGDRERFGKERRYQPPSLPTGQVDPSTLGEKDLGDLLSGAGDARALSRTVSGVGRDLAELLLACEDAPGTLAKLLEVEGPGRVVEKAGRRFVLVGGPEELPEGYRAEPYPDLTTLTRKVFLEAAGEERRERTRRECRQALEKLLGRLERQLEKNRTGREECERADQVQALGELLKVNLGRIEKGARSVTLTDFSSGEPVERTVALDGRKSPRANMDRYFHRAKRLRIKLPVLERKARHLEADLEETRELLSRFAEEGTDPLAFKEELRALGVLDGLRKPSKRPEKGKARGKKGKKKRRELRSFVSSDGLRILVGRSNEENDYLVRRAGKKGDAWLHAEGAAGAHVLVKLPGKMERPPKRTLEEAAQLAAHFSKQRYEKKARIMLSRIGVVKKAPNSPPGQVLVPKYETIVVPTDPGVVRRLTPLGGNSPGR